MDAKAKLFLFFFLVKFFVTWQLRFQNEKKSTFRCHLREMSPNVCGSSNTISGRKEAYHFAMSIVVFN